MEAVFDQFARVAAALSTSSRLKLIDRGFNDARGPRVAARGLRGLMYKS